MPPKTRRTPQEKKRLSLKKDRRNGWGGNKIGTRLSLPRNKANASRAVRRADAVDLRLDPETAENRLLLRLRRRWRKAADISLDEVLSYKEAARKERVGGKVRRARARPPFAQPPRRHPPKKH